MENNNLNNNSLNNNNNPSHNSNSDYVRIESAFSARDQRRPSESDDTTLAQPVGGVYERVYNERTHASAGESSGAQATGASHSQPQGQTAGGSTTVKTKHHKNSGLMKAVAALVIGAVIGGAAGGAVGYGMGDRDSNSGKITAVSSSGANQTQKVSYSENGDMTVSSIAEKAMPAVVSVYNIANNTRQSIFGSSSQSAEGQAQGYGSGVIISADGMIVTNYHVIEGSDSVVVTTSDDKQYKAEVLGTDSTLDIAVLKIDASDLPYVEIADSDQVKVGDLAVAIGNPLGSEFANTVTDGIISGVDRKISSENGDLGLLQTNASINSGNSGGALLNGQAQLIGINSMKIQSNGMTSVEGMGFAIPSNVVLDFVNSVKDGSYTKNSTKKAWIGISGYSLDEGIASQVGTDVTEGVLIASVTDGGPAASAGLEMGDILTKVDGKEIKSFEDLSDYLSEKSPGDEVTFTVNRDGQTGEVKVTLGTQSSES